MLETNNAKSSITIEIVDPVLSEMVRTKKEDEEMRRTRSIGRVGYVWLMLRIGYHFRDGLSNNLKR